MMVKKKSKSKFLGWNTYIQENQCPNLQAQTSSLQKRMTQMTDFI